MQMTSEARTWLDATVRRILARHPLGDAARAGITYELMSHLHSAGEARARAAQRLEVTREDLEAALAEAGGDAALAAAFVQPLSRPIERVLLGRRLAALAIDAIIVFIGVFLIHSSIEYVLVQHMGMTVSTSSGQVPLWMRFFPWGYHDPGLPFAIQAIFALASGGWVLAYFVWTEGHDGRTLGKRALDLTVMRTDGLPLTFREAFVRNVVKVLPALLVLDTLIMLLAFAKDKQRLSDRIAKTIVVRA